jgi:hypothetical protein
MARDWVIEDMLCRGIRVDLLGSLLPTDVVAPPAPGKVLLVRHFDLTGKACPSYFVQNKRAWEDFIRYVAAAVNGGRA